MPEGWRSVLDAHDRYDRPVVLVHAEHPALLRMALFDVVVNNADRKGGHILLGPEGEVRGVDHGLSFNLDEKLRTVLWGWAGEPVPEEHLDALRALREQLDGALGTALAERLERREIATTARRLDRLVTSASLPLPATAGPRSRGPRSDGRRPGRRRVPG